MTMTFQSEQRLIGQGHRAPSLRVVGGRCGDCGGNVVVEPVQNDARAWAWLRACCLCCGLADERPLSAPRPLPTADDMLPQRRGLPRKGTALDGGDDAA